MKPFCLAREISSKQKRSFTESIKEISTRKRDFRKENITETSRKENDFTVNNMVVIAWMTKVGNILGRNIGNILRNYTSTEGLYPNQRNQSQSATEGTVVWGACFLEFRKEKR